MNTQIDFAWGALVFLWFVTTAIVIYIIVYLRRRAVQQREKIDDQQGKIDELYTKINDLREERASIRLGNAQEKIDALENALLEQRQRVNEVHSIASDNQRAVQERSRLLLVAIHESLKPDEVMTPILQARWTVGEYLMIAPATQYSIEQLVNTQKGFGVPIRYMHLAVPIGVDEILVNEHEALPIDWLVHLVSGTVEILVLDWFYTNMAIDKLAGVVNTVVTLTSSVEVADKRAFFRIFWRAIHNGETPQEAYQAAIEHSPPSVRGKVQALYAP